jgi:tetratricopeptide (TPR) repeat protein
MNLEQCYQLFNLLPGATADDIRSAYRRLARIMHPDVNPADAHAHLRFVTLNQAYQVLLDAADAPATVPVAAPALHTPSKPTATLSRQEAELKWSSYQKLQELLRQREFVKTVALVDGLAYRLGTDRDVQQWQGIVYYFFGQHLVDRDQVDKAKIYLKKALKADPHNSKLWEEVNYEYQRIDRIVARF